MFRDYKNYDVLEDGRIWSKVKKKFLKPHSNRGGYQQVSLFDNEGKRHVESLHKVIYFAVNGLWEYPEGYELNHIDEDKTNNNISNLEMVTPKYNVNYGTRNARTAKALSKRVGAFKNNELIMVFSSTQEAHRNGFCSGHICDCCNGKRKTHKGFQWRYLDEEQ